MRNHRSDQEVALPAHLNQGPTGRNAPSRVDRRAVVTASGQAGGLAGRVDAAHLHRHRGDTGQAQDQHHHQGGDGQRRLNRARPGTAGYVLVLSARPMTLVSADTMESPVTTV